MPTAGAAYFDGGTDKIAGANVGSTDSTKFTLSIWANLDDKTERCMISSGTSNWWMLEHNPASSGQFRGYFNANTGGAALDFRSNWPAGLSVSTWYHCLISLDLSDTAKRHCYVNGVPSVVWTVYNTTKTLDFTEGQLWVGQWNDTPGSIKFKGGISQVWFQPDLYIDLSIEANRAPFYQSGSAVDLGPNGEYPTGSSPLYCFQNDYDTFETNSGTGTNPFTVSGALTAITGPDIVPGAGGGGAFGIHRVLHRTLERTVDRGLDPFNHGY